MSHAPSPMVERFVELFNQLGAGNLQLLDELYGADALFVDPLHRLEGLVAIKDYFATLYQRVEECRFELLDHTGRPGDEVLSWRMTLRHPRLGGGKPVVVEGCSWLKYDQQIRYHRDFFDVGAMLYEQLPLVGSVVRAIKRQVAA